MIHIREDIGKIMEKVEKWYHGDCGRYYEGVCYHSMNYDLACCGETLCTFIRDGWREDIAMEMRQNIMIDVDAFPSDWDMLAEYFTIK